MAPRKARTVALQVNVPVEVAGELLAFLERHGGTLDGYLGALIKRRLVEIRRIEGRWPDWPSYDQKREAKRANLRPEVL
ncbi:hypothetical protein [Cyanobium sp. Lug-B]|uniref:hypothetical protein n=1 Tax=Cyanobium sp. Lug-B TaxID=2823716 RepID=UPI0020CCFB7E|nr:hypothetical protein [Cyanobium sp. Lug-B]MCP9796107.1 hypothetical protein [Cyanobium sp. Lug-B]